MSKQGKDSRFFSHFPQSRTMPGIISSKIADIECKLRFGLITNEEVRWLIKTLRQKMAELVELDRQVIKACNSIDSVLTEIKSIVK